MQWFDSDFNDDYFDLLSTVLKEKEVRLCEKHKINWRREIGVRLLELRPTLDHQPVLAFLASGALPRHKTARSLRNAFFAREGKISSRTFSKYKSQGLKWRGERLARLRAKYGTDLDKAMEAVGTEARDRLLLHLGFGKADSYVDVRSSNLVCEEHLPSGNAPARHVRKKPWSA
jgi:hypothetical protein